MKFTVAGIENASSADTAERIGAWLVARGYADPQVSTGFDRHTGYLQVTVETDRDPTDDLRQYTPTPSPREVKRVEMITAARAQVRAVAQRPAQSRSPIEQLVLGLAAMTPEFAGDVE